MASPLEIKPERIAEVKVVLLGESSVGKSSVLERLQNNTFNDSKSSTIGAAFVSKKIVKDSSLINLQIWDTAGQERFHNLTPLYYRNANVALIVFDLTSETSFSKAEYWINELQSYINEEDHNIQLDIILVGNKLDLLHLKENQKPLINENGEEYTTVDMYNECLFKERIHQFMTEHQITQFFETSAKEDVQINELFQYIVNNVNESLFVSNVDESNIKSKRGLIDIGFGNNSGFTSSNSCQC